MPNKTDDDAVEPKTYVIFRLGDKEFGVDVMNIKEIVKVPPITRVPRSADFIEGVINLGGSLATVINLRKRFGLEPKEINADSRIIIAEFGDNLVGMLVDATTEVLRIPASNIDIEATPEMFTTEISKEYLAGVGKIENRRIILLDLKQVLTAKEGN
ncbi:MAG: chemotaxis protein CheW [Methanophagales archaeon]|nr:chemotaxis protein CheW [Methanophagales archaeon]MCW3141671.1 chemotaxis protein CheW [Methanophagales archaeon]